MSDTPETDAALYPMNGVDIVWPEFARQLERERDEARNDLEFRREVYRVQENYLELARQERDEAREKLEEEMKWHHRTHAELVQIQCKLLDTERERDDLRDRLNELLNRPTLV